MNRLNAPLVSILIPVEEQTTYLRNVLDSILSQTFTEFELIVSDDTNSDTIRTIVEGYGQKGLTITYIGQSTPLGRVANLNFLLHKAHGKWIKYMHDDDWFVENTALMQLVMQAEYSMASFVFSGSTSRLILKGYDRYNFISPKEYEALKKDPTLLMISNPIVKLSACMFLNDRNLKFDTTLKDLAECDYFIRFLHEHGGLKALKNNLIHLTELSIRINGCRHAGFAVETLVLFGRYAAISGSPYRLASALGRCLGELSIRTGHQLKKMGFHGTIPQRYLFVMLLISIGHQVKQALSIRQNTMNYAYPGKEKKRRPEVENMVP